MVMCDYSIQAKLFRPQKPFFQRDSGVAQKK